MSDILSANPPEHKDKMGRTWRLLRIDPLRCRALFELVATPIPGMSPGLGSRLWFYATPEGYQRLWADRTDTLTVARSVVP